MPSFLTYAAAAALAFSSASAQDQPVPLKWRGAWTTTRTQSFALANAADPTSYWCIPPPGPTVISRVGSPAISNITASTVSLGAFALAQITVGIAQFTAPAVNASTWSWSAYNPATGILEMYGRTTAGTIEIQCFYATMNAAGTTGTLVVLGGQAYSDNWQLQCDPAQYAAIANVATAPYCASLAGTSYATNSTTIYTLVSNGTSPAGVSPSETPTPSASASVTGTPTVTASPSTSPSTGASPSSTPTGSIVAPKTSGADAVGTLLWVAAAGLLAVGMAALA